MNKKTDLLLYLADTNHILSQQSAEWCGHGPILEQDIALTNITLDLLGQSRNFYQYAAMLMQGKETEDSLAYLRSEREYKNLLITELPKGDWAFTIAKHYLYSEFAALYYEALKKLGDDQLTAICEKSLKEIHYHIRWSSEWVIRLGDGTDESHTRMQNAIIEIWPYTGEMFMPAAFEEGIDLEAIRNLWQQKVQAILSEATLDIPQNAFMQSGGKQGAHTENMGYILAEMQYLQRSHPGAEW